MGKNNVLNIKGEKASNIELNDTVWSIEPNDAVLYDALTLARNNARQGTADTKTRSEVSGGGRKPWNKKGTGRARQGSTRAPQWIKGGIVFGPHPRSFAKKMNRKERRLALKSALSYKLLESKLIVLDELKFADRKTKTAIEFLNNLEIEKTVLVVVAELEENLVYATRNLRNVILLEANEVNTYDVIAADKMVITKDAIKQIEEVLV